MKRKENFPKHWTEEQKTHRKFQIEILEMAEEKKIFQRKLGIILIDLVEELKEWEDKTEPKEVSK